MNGEAVYTVGDSLMNGLWAVLIGTAIYLTAAGIVSWIRYLNSNVELDDLTRVQTVAMLWMFAIVAAVVTVVILSGIGHVVHYVGEIIF